MATKNPLGGSRTEGGCQCRVEAIVPVDERGQVVLPKELREQAGIQRRDKLAVLRWDQGCGLDGLLLVRAEALTRAAAEALGPLAKPAFGSSTRVRRSVARRRSGR